VIFIESIRRWLGRKGMTSSHWSELQHWAEERQFELRRTRGQDGFAIEGRQGSLPWRMEWGPAQRSYIQGHELRLRADVGLAPELQAVLMNIRLRERLENEAFDPSLVQDKGQMPPQTPPEVRWLVSYEPLGPADIRSLSQRWAAVSNVRTWTARWLSGPLAQDLDELECHPELPVMVMMARGRCTLRVAMAQPHVGAIQPWLHLFESCVREAQRTGSAGCASDDHEATQPGLFIPSASAEREQLSLN
jgi:hypothetical protein